MFRGGCSREAAAVVVEASLPILTGLIDKSLLRSELIRQYAAEQLAADAVKEKK